MIQMPHAPWARADTNGHGEKAPTPYTALTKEQEPRVVRALGTGLWYLSPPALRAMDFNLLLSPLWGS